MNPTVWAFKDRVRKGKRPALPPNCPDRLSILIHRCWDGSPLNRPNFQDICTELRYIKGLLLTGMIISPPHHVHSNESSVSGDRFYPYHNSPTWSTE
jgi:hypothetical protein